MISLVRKGIYAIKLLLSLPKIIYINFAVFPFHIAIKFPIKITYNVKIASIHKKAIKIEGPIERFMIDFNWSGSEGINYFKSNKAFLKIAPKATIIFKGRAKFCHGFVIRVDQGELIFGENFVANKHSTFYCEHHIEFGNNCSVGWNFYIRDTDGHPIYHMDDLQTIINKAKPISIGNKVWIAADVKILKGVTIPDGCIIAQNSCVTRSFTSNNAILGGTPTTILKENIIWDI